MAHPSIISAQQLPNGTQDALVEESNDPTPLDPGQDPFALSPELLQLFGQQTDEQRTNSLFNGDGMKYNGLFSMSTRQLGGARPFTSPVVSNEEDVDPGGPTFVMLSSEYSPPGDLTKDSDITLKVRMKNTGENTAEDIFFFACLQDDYIELLEEPNPEPPFTNDPQASLDADDEAIDPNDPRDPGGDPAPEPSPTFQDPTINECVMRLEWDSIDGEPIDLGPGEEQIFSWSFKAKRDDVVIRWRLVAEYGAAQSVLRHWIPVKNPNPTGGSAGPGGANGIPSSCSDATGSDSVPFPEGSNNQQLVSQISDRWAIHLRDQTYSWQSERYKPVIKVLWDTLSAVECTPFLTEMKSKQSGNELAMYAGIPSGGGWGDYGLVNPGALTIDIEDLLGTINGGTPDKATWLFIHEMAHAYSNDRNSAPAYYAEYTSLYNQHGAFSGYGASGGENENFADVLGYYVGRCAVEGGQSNPYSGSSAGVSAYYEYAKSKIFGGQEFGPTPPGTPSC